MTTALDEALAKFPPGDDPRRRLLAIQLRSVAVELDADPTGRPALITSFVNGVFAGGLESIGGELGFDD